MCPIAYAIVRTVNPKANATPSSPIPTPGNAAARTALPQPPNTSQKVPMNSATDFLCRLIVFLALQNEYSEQCTASTDRQPTYQHRSKAISGDFEFGVFGDEFL